MPINKPEKQQGKRERKQGKKLGKRQRRQMPFNQNKKIPVQYFLVLTVAHASAMICGLVINVSALKGSKDLTVKVQLDEILKNSNINVSSLTYINKQVNHACSAVI